MVSVASLLNPVPDERRNMISPCPSRSTSESRTHTSPPNKKQKMTKDAAVFVRGKLQGQLRYPPVENYESKTEFELHKFRLHPQGNIADFRRHIPYNSDKKTFLERTGRGAFEVFQYTFQKPGDDKIYTVMWDYNIGLVRMTPFFKCCQYAKTVPAKMLNSNPGLREICHSITGGALVAQGYWMPFEAAKAIASTFCYDIRYALVPLFGEDFVKTCIAPGSEGYGQMVIDTQIVQRCTLESQYYREIASREASRTPKTPTTPEFRSGEMSSWMSKRFRAKQNVERRPCLDIESGYCTDIDQSESYLPSPQSTFASASSQRRNSLSVKGPTSMPYQGDIPVSPVSGRYADITQSSSQDSSESDISPKTKKRQLANTNNGDDNDEEMAECTSPDVASEKDAALAGAGMQNLSPITSTKDTRAAYVLMQLHFADTSLKDDHAHIIRTAKKRRASS